MSSSNQSASEDSTVESIDERQRDDAETGGTGLTRRTGLKLAGAAGLGLLAGGSGQAAASTSQARPWNQDVDAREHALLNLGELEMSVGGGPIRDFEGENLHIDQGRLRASSKVTFHHVDDYGADPTGEEASDAAVDAAIDAAEPGDWIALTNGTYYLAEQHHIYKELIIYGAGGIIESDVHPETGYFDGPVDGTQFESVHSIFSFYGDKGESVSLAESVHEGSDQVPVQTTDPFEVGGGVLVNNDAEDTADTYYPTVSTVREIDDGVLYLDIPLRYDYDAEEPHNVYPLDFLDNAGFVECHFRNRHDFYWDDELRKVMGGFRDPMFHQHCRRPLVVNCTMSGYDTKGWTCVDVLEALVINLRAEQPMNVNGQHAETIYISGSTNVNIYNPVIRETRRGIDIAGGLRAVGDEGGRGGCKDVNVYNPDISGVSHLGLSFHNSSSTHVAGNMNVYGGRIDCKPTDPTQDDHGGEPDRRWEFQRGRGFQDSREDGRLYINGTTIIARERAGSCYGRDTLIEGCTFRTVPAGGGDTRSVGDLPALAISGENITVRDTVIEANANGTDHTQAVQINGATNVDLDVNVRGTFGENPISVNGGRQIRVQARLGDAEYDEGGIRLAGSIEDLEVSGSAHHGGHGVQAGAGADATNVTLRDFTHYGDRPAVSLSEDAAFENLRLAGVTASGEENDFDFGGAFVDGLWVKDCVLDELRGLHPDQESDENTFLADNRTGWTGSA